MTGGDAVVAERVRKAFGSLTALDDVSLTVRRGAFFGLLGPNGAGKTTLIGALGGLTRFDSARGRIVVEGADVIRRPLEARARIGIVPQELTYDPFLTVEEALTFQSKYYGLGANKAWISELLERLHLTDKAKVNTRRLSGGMKRRLMIAQALVHKPPLIVLDEPTAGVDINLRLSLWEFARELSAAGRTIILTTHYLEEAENLCDEVALMNRGRVVAVGKTRDLLAAGRAEARLRIAGGRLPAGVSAARQEDGDWHVFALERLADLEELLAALRRGGAEILELAVSPPRLEDVVKRMLAE